MTIEKLKEYNERLKTEPLSETEWKELEEFVPGNLNSQKLNIKENCPLIYVHFEKSNTGYKLFTEIIGKMLNDKMSKKMKDSGLIAISKNEGHGDGKNSCISFELHGMPVAKMSVLEEYTKFKKNELQIDNLIKEILKSFR